MTPISRIINSSQVFLDYEPSLPFDSMLVQWRPVSTVSSLGSGETNSSTIITGAVFVSWLVSLSNEEVKGFIVKGEIQFCVFPRRVDSFQIASLPFLTSISFNTPPHSPILISRFLYLCTRHSPFGEFTIIFPEYLISVYIS